MKSIHRKWTSLLLVIAIVVGLLPPMMVQADASRIVITSLNNVATDSSTGLPQNTNNVIRYTSNPISITASIENISDLQIPNIYFEITNVNTGSVTTVKNNKAFHAPNTFDITFNNVELTEGLNKIIIKLGDTSIVASAPGWAYFTPTTNISDLMINGEPFVDNKMYPSNPGQSTRISVTGKAPNATEVQAFLLGDSIIKNAFLEPKTAAFFIDGDDYFNTSSTANFKFKPGDNELTIIAKNNTKSYHVTKNLIYNNGKPFAFNAFVYDKPSNVTYDPARNQKLIGTPTVINSNVKVSANLKDDLTPTGDLQYRYVDIMVSGQKFGPYDLMGADAATRVSGIWPISINAGYSPTKLTVNGAALHNGVNLVIEDKSGSVVLPPAATPLVPSNIDSTKTVALFDLPPAVLTNAGSPYKVKVMNNATDVLGEFNLQVTPAATPALPIVDIANTNTNFAGFKEGYVPVVKQVEFAAAPTTASSVRIDVTDWSGQQILRTANGVNIAGSAVTFNFPTGLAQGSYKYRISYNNELLTEQPFDIQQADPQLPVVNSPAVPLDILNINTPMYIPVSGQRLGTSKVDNATPSVTTAYITNATLVAQSDPTITINLGVADEREDRVLFRLSNASTLNDGEVYDLYFDQEVLYPDGTTFTTVTDMKVTGAVKGVDATTVTGYFNEKVSDITPRQVLLKNMSITPLTVTGVNLADQNKLLVELLSEDLLPVPGSSTNVSGINNSNPAQSIATVNVGGVLQGNYIIRVSYNGVVLAQYPFVVANPSISYIDPTTQPGTPSPTDKITITGLGLGRDASALKVRFKSDKTQASIAEQPVKSLAGGNKAVIDSPTLPEGTYDVIMLYNGEESGSAAKYTVANKPNKLKENASLSTNQYKVFEFETTLTLPAEKNQLIEYKFYNSPLDTRMPTTTFAFYYVDPNMPYVDSVKRAVGEAQLTETGDNEINELPTSLKVYVSDLTQKVNVYYGDVDSNSQPAQSLTSRAGSPGNYYFTFDLNNLPNGTTKLTVIPSLNGTAGKAGENLAGKKVYGLRISSTPYIIVNNIYNGMVVKDKVSEISCKMPSGALTGSCLQFRLVNVDKNDITPVGTPPVSKAKVEILINDAAPIVLQSSHYDGVRGLYNVQYSSNFIKEGKNTIKFLIYQDGVLVTQSQFEVFVFSTNAPEFVAVKPVEDTDIPKFIAKSTPDSYATSQTSVVFSGQFVNATELKLTVRQKGDDGQSIVKYDRRYGPSYGQRDPVTGNPNYLLSVGQPNGQFTTNAITLGKKGDTIFEFSITNNSGVTVTKVITITREPLPYVILYPTLTKNAAGKDQANINSNYIEIEMEAENADSVTFGKKEAVKREVTDASGNKKTHFFYEIRDLKNGNNAVKFTVKRGTQSTNGEFILFNANTPIEGAQFKTGLKPSMKVFNGEVELKFPRSTNFMRNEPGSVNQYLTADRQILFGIANGDDGRVDKFKHPSPTDGQIGNPNPLISPEAKLLLTEPTGRFRPASKLFWIDAGTIPKIAPDPTDALIGGGRLPYDPETFYTRSENDLVVPTQDGTLTLKYDTVIRTDSWKYVTVYHYDYYEDYRGVKQWRWKNIGGVVDPTKNTITVPFERFGYYRVMYMEQSYDDVISHPWARNDLDTLYSKGIMLNKSNSAFIPNDPISRGEFATLLVKIFEIPLQYTDTPTFSDVLRVNPLTNGLYDYKYIETAARAGIVRGSGGGRFSPDESISRQDAAVMIARAANLKLATDPDKSLTALQKLFTDANSIDMYARTAIEAVNKAGLIQGKENTLLQGQKKKTFRYDPIETFTRAEAAAVAIRVLKQQKKIPK